MKTPTERAAQLWCLPQFEKREMDGDFCRAIAETIAIAVMDERERCAVVVENDGGICVNCARVAAIHVRETKHLT